MKRLAQIILGIGLVVVVLLVSMVLLGFYLNDRAAADAKALCQSITPGTRESEAVRMGLATRARHLTASDRHIFAFQGWVFNAVSCQVTITNGSVASVAVVELSD